jgi:uncharacterized membrane protein YgcG
MRRLSSLLFVVAAFAFSFPLHARSISWRTFDVEAHLDHDGRLHVKETQGIVFDGDWNGGERSFNLRNLQGLSIDRVTRIDDGVSHELQKGSLDEVDHWDYAGKDDVIRWRSRAASDPAFENRLITYVLEVTFSNVLEPLGDGRFRLNHDFGMPKRDGSIERYSLHLTFDPVWTGAEAVSMTASNVAPGGSALVTRELTYAGTGLPAGVERRTPKWVGWLFVIALTLFIAFLTVRFIAREKERGRFEPVTAHRDDELLRIAPEVLGAAWDGKVGAPEVAAVLARLAQEKKIESHVEKKTLHMKLLVDRGDLDGYEHALVRSMFVSGSNTDTDKIKEHYKSVGFDPASKIKDGIESRLSALPAWREPDLTIRLRRHIWTILGSLALLIGTIAIAKAPAEIGLMFGSVVTGLIFGGIGAGVAGAASKKIDSSPLKVVFWPLFLLGLGALPFFIAAANAGSLGIRPPLLVAQTLWLAAWASLLFDNLRIRDSSPKIAFRRRIAGLRHYFIDELKTPQPALQDAWYPTLLAFGLGTNVDRWFRANPTPSRVDDDRSSWSNSSSSSSSFSSSESSGSSGSSWTGGGGAFGGAGSSGTWALAAAGMASGVSAPSSSSDSGGGSSSSSSSGGGGGGGW